MTLEPTVVERSEQPYAAIASTVTMQSMAEVLPPLGDEVLDYLSEAGLTPAGPLFWKYNVIDMAADLEVEVGVPVDRQVEDSERVVGGVLPGGRYVVARHVGHPDTLEQATADLLAWADDQGLSWDVVDADGQERWVARLEEYLSDPDTEPDLNKWQTNLVFRVRQ